MYDLYHSQVLTVNDVKVESVSLVTRFSGHRCKEEPISNFNFQVTAFTVVGLSRFLERSIVKSSQPARVLKRTWRQRVIRWRETGRILIALPLPFVWLCLLIILGKVKGVHTLKVQGSGKNGETK